MHLNDNGNNIHLQKIAFHKQSKNSRTKKHLKISIQCIYNEKDVQVDESLL